LGYYGYCLGLWGRNSLLLQYLFQCKCSSFSEEWRYPKDVDVIVSACNVGWVDLSPSGNLLYVREKKMVFASNYLLNLKTGEKINITDQPYAQFLTDNLGFIESGLEDDIVDIKTGTKYPIQTFRYWDENAYKNGEPNLELLVSALHQAEQIFLTPNYSTVIVLMPNFLTNLNQGFTFNQSDFPNWGPRRVERFLQENNINFQNVTSFPEEAVSPDGRFIARREGIFLVETNQKIVDGVALWLRGWTNDGSGVVYSTHYGGPCLIPLYLPMADDTGCLVEVDRPVLLLKVPSEYLSPTRTP